MVSLQRELTEENKFGGRNQHDAEDFLNWFLDKLEADLNKARDKKSLTALTASQQEVRRQQPDIRSCWMEWQRFLHNNNSFISQTFRGQTISYLTCPKCDFVQKSWEPWLDVQLEIPLQGQGTLEDALNTRFNSNQAVDDYRCDNCKHVGGERRERLSRCPDVFIIMLRRHGYNWETKETKKVRTRVTFPLDGLSLDPYFISLEGRGPEQLDNGVLEPFVYDCYAVIQHRGTMITSGHYWALVRERAPDDPAGEAWYKYNDSEVTKIPHQGVRKATQAAESYILFYHRRKA
jgi:ubiquitin carboxyl-terminal hydrolase 8